MHRKYRSGRESEKERAKEHTTPKERFSVSRPMPRVQVLYTQPSPTNSTVISPLLCSREHFPSCAEERKCTRRFSFLSGVLCCVVVGRCGVRNREGKGSRKKMLSAVKAYLKIHVWKKCLGRLGDCLTHSPGTKNVKLQKFLFTHTAVRGAIFHENSMLSGEIVWSCVVESLSFTFTLRAFCFGFFSPFQRVTNTCKRKAWKNIDGSTFKCEEKSS